MASKHLSNVVRAESQYGLKVASRDGETDYHTKLEMFEMMTNWRDRSDTTKDADTAETVDDCVERASTDLSEHKFVLFPKPLRRQLKFLFNFRDFHYCFTTVIILKHQLVTENFLIFSLYVLKAKNSIYMKMLYSFCTVH